MTTAATSSLAKYAVKGSNRVLEADPKGRLTNHKTLWSKIRFIAEAAHSAVGDILIKKQGPVHKFTGYEKTASETKALEVIKERLEVEISGILTSADAKSDAAAIVNRVFGGTTRLQRNSFHYILSDAYAEAESANNAGPLLVALEKSFDDWSGREGISPDVKQKIIEKTAKSGLKDYSPEHVFARRGWPHQAWDQFTIALFDIRSAANTPEFKENTFLHHVNYFLSMHLNKTELASIEGSSFKEKMEKYYEKRMETDDVANRESMIAALVTDENLAKLETCVNPNVFIIGLISDVRSQYE
jgi:hypothetical protein